MDLYNSIIDKIDGMLGSSEPKRYKFDPDINGKTLAETNLS